MGTNLKNTEDDLVFYNENLTWENVARASGIGEIKTYTR